MTSPVRDKGAPATSNGATTMSLGWRLESNAVKSCRVILEVTRPPIGVSTYFWALQASFKSSGAALRGAGHLGLQWHHSYPGHTAVNWGGYHPNGSELSGTTSPLPSAAGNANTRDYPWKARRRYELAIKHGAQGWAGIVTDLVTKQATVVRYLDAGDSAWLSDIVVWSEVFADCDAPSSQVRWSGLEAGGRAVRKVTANYQSYASGGCTNTNQVPTTLGLTQTTKTRRTVAGGSVLTVPR